MGRPRQRRELATDDTDGRKVARTDDLDGEDDHVHVLFRAKPTTDLLKVIDTGKGATARRIRNEDGAELKTELWGDSFWKDSYCPLSTGQVSLDMPNQYVEDQREN